MLVRLAQEAYRGPSRRNGSIPAKTLGASTAMAICGSCAAPLHRATLGTGSLTYGSRTMAAWKGAVGE
jgi:hypothetical protein